MAPGGSRFRSLAGKLLAIYLPLVSLSAVALFAAIELRSYHGEVGQLKRAVQQVSLIQSAAFTTAVWEYNDDQLDVLLADLQRTPHFRGAVVYDSFGEVLSRAGEIDGADPELLADTTLVYETEHVREEIGRLVIAFHRDRLHAELRQRFQADAIVLGVLMLILVGVTILATRRLIVRPIARLQSAIDRLRAENVREVVQWQSHDELGQVVVAYNEMQAKQAAAEAVLNDYKAHLEQLVDERTAELRQARDAANAASRAKGEFLSNMSHELRTPLNGVLGYAQILQRDPAITARQQQSLSAIESCGQHLLTLINDVLDLSKIEAGRLEIDAAPIDLHRLLQGVFDIVRPRGESKGLQIALEVSPEVPRGVVTDATKLKQTLVNLLGNAVKFTETGSVTLLARETEDGRLEFRIRDTGIGMTPTEMEEIFDPFKQAEGGKTSGGTGLGLAISKRIVEALDGALTVESEPGRGSCFTIAIPLIEASDEDLSVLAEGETGALSNPVLAAGQDVTILVADDRETNRDILVQLLESAGFRTVQASDGREALDRLRETPMPLALMDVRMPGMNGIDATKEIRRDPALRDTVVIAVTASVFPDFQKKIGAAGFDDFIGKPFRAAEVFTKIQAHLDIEFADAAAPETDAREETAGRATGLTGAQAASIAGRIRSAVKLGNVTALNALASELQAADGSAPCGRRIGELAGAFDFASLERLADELEGPDPREPMPT